MQSSTKDLFDSSVSSLRKRPMARRFANPLLLAAMLMLGPASVSASAWSCFQTGFVDPGVDLSGDEIQGMRVQGEDLLVDVRWSNASRPDGAFLLIDEAGETVGMWDAPRTANLEETRTLIGALSHVATKGFQYTLSLVEGDQVLLERELRVGVLCPDGEACRYVVRGGLHGTALTVSAAFGQALVEAREAGAEDVLEHVRVGHPELESEIPGLAWQMQRTRGGGTGVASPCVCEWLTLQQGESTPPSSPGQYSGNSGMNPTHRSILKPNGAGFLAAAQTVDGNIEVLANETWGKTTLGLELLCTKIVDKTARTFPTEWSPLSELEVDEPTLEICPMPCTPKIEHQVQVNGCTGGAAVGRFDQSASVVGSIEATLQLSTSGSPGTNTVSLFVDAAALDLQADNGRKARGAERINKLATDVLLAPGALSMIEAQGSLDVTASKLTTFEHTYAFGALMLEYIQKLSVDAASQACEGIPGALAFHLYLLDNGNNGGGVVIERWENP